MDNTLARGVKIEKRIAVDKSLAQKVMEVVDQNDFDWWEFNRFIKKGFPFGGKHLIKKMIVSNRAGQIIMLEIAARYCINDIGMIWHKSPAEAATNKSWLEAVQSNEHNSQKGLRGYDQEGRLLCLQMLLCQDITNNNGDNFWKIAWAVFCCNFIGGDTNE